MSVEVKLEDLKKAYKEAVDNKKEIFTFKGKELYTDYAKYVIELMESLEKNGDRK